MIAKVNSISAFDANDESSHLISFSWSDYGIRVTSLRCVIKLDDKVVYQKTITYADATGVFQFELLPISKETANPFPYNEMFKNGNTYHVWILGSTDGTFPDELTTSTMGYFECISAPSLSFTNLEGSANDDGTYTFKMNYHQDEGRKIDSLTVKFRANIQSESVSTTIPVYAIELDGENNATIEYTASNISNSQLYYVQAYGSCDGGMTFDTGVQAFSPVEEGYQDYHFISALNMSESGGIRVSTNIISANGSLYDEYGNFINTEEQNGKTVVPESIRPTNGDNTAIDLTGKKLVYNKGYIINGNFDFLVHCSNLKKNQVFMTFEYLKSDGTPLNNPNVVGSLYYREGHNGQERTHGFFEYVVESTYEDDYGFTFKNKRTYLSNPMPLAQWSSYKNKTWGELQDGSWDQFLDKRWYQYVDKPWTYFVTKTWGGLETGNNFGREFGIRVSRIDDYYNVKCIAYDLLS